MVGTGNILVINLTFVYCLVVSSSSSMQDLNGGEYAEAQRGSPGEGRKNATVNAPMHGNDHRLFAKVAPIASNIALKSHGRRLPWQSCRPNSCIAPRSQHSSVRVSNHSCRLASEPGAKFGTTRRTQAPSTN
jgi:hypothetical protein